MAWTVPRWQAIAGLEQRFGDRASSAPPGVSTLRQVHGREVFDAGTLGTAEREGDGLASDRSGSRVGVWTADCVPVHLLAPASRVVAAVHSGWRGSAAGVVEAALDLLRARWNVEAHEVEAALGPAIGGCCYEVGEEVREAFVARHGSLASEAFRVREGSLRLDLRTFLEAELLALGVGSVERVGPCTACRVDLLFSYRREGKTGRQLSYIGWA